MDRIITLHHHIQSPLPLNFLWGWGSTCGNCFRRLAIAAVTCSIDTTFCTSKMIHHWGVSLSEHALLLCHGTQTTDNSRICHCLQFHEYGKQNFVHPFLRSRKLLRYTHAWTKLHNVVMTQLNLWCLWVSLCVTLTWSELNYCAWFDGTVCEQPGLVCHGPQSHSVDPSVLS